MCLINLKYYKVNIDSTPMYLEVRPLSDNRYLCFFSTLYNNDQITLEDKYDTYGFKVIMHPTEINL